VKIRGEKYFALARAHSERMSLVDDALRDLVIANRILAAHSVLDAFGHVSIRHPEDPGRYVLARSKGPAGVTRADLIDFTLDSEPLNANGRAMYAERHIHGKIYTARPDVQAVCHNHSAATIPFGVTNVPLRPIFHMGSVIGADVPTWDIAHEFGDTNLLVTTPEQGASLAKTLAGGRVVLMRGHGSAVAARTLREVVFTSVYLQKNAELVTSARGFGEAVHYLSPGEIERAATLLFEPLSQDRAWNAWSSAVDISAI
jgi:ribulose-5-phosphate 4-epimerase/fuculose-1-phosphate aldolase